MNVFGKEEWANISIQTFQTHMGKYISSLLASFGNKGGPTKF